MDEWHSMHRIDPYPFLQDGTTEIRLPLEVALQNLPSVAGDMNDHRSARKHAPTISQYFPPPPLLVNVKRFRESKSGSSSYFPKSPSPQRRKGSQTATPNSLSAPLESLTYGLIQEELAHNSFHVLVATIFLNKTQGGNAVPFVRDFLKVYPTPRILASTNSEDISQFIEPLGLQNRRAGILVAMAEKWMEQPPRPGIGYKRRGYPSKAAGVVTELGADREYGNDGSWEIAHLPGVGEYALDSWRIFCRDRFLAEKDDVQSDGAAEQYGDCQAIVDEGDIEGVVDVVVERGKRCGKEKQEWEGVVPDDKELKAWMEWRRRKADLRLGLTDCDMV